MGTLESERWSQNESSTTDVNQRCAHSYEIPVKLIQTNIDTSHQDHRQLYNRHKITDKLNSKTQFLRRRVQTAIQC